MSVTQTDRENTAASKPNKGGLEGIVAATTSISKVEGTAGRLIYRGYNIHDLARNATFEEIIHLLWFDKLPNATELAQLQSKLAAQRSIPEPVMATIRLQPKTSDPMDVLRTAVSAWGALSVSGTPTLDQAIALTARFPVFLAAFQRLRNGKEPLESRPELGHAANYLYLLTGEEPKEEHVRGLNSYLVLL
ncbi:MAG: citrate synthase/methylcitrate synthase, partial [Ktedonobacteraceae bacterium]|nr:citrate synthase/methylcitrate synthase [Ktedonobacteraceae bacterium]